MRPSSSPGTSVVGASVAVSLFVSPPASPSEFEPSALASAESGPEPVASVASESSVRASPPSESSSGLVFTPPSEADSPLVLSVLSVFSVLSLSEFASSSTGATQALSATETKALKTARRRGDLMYFILYYLSFLRASIDTNSFLNVRLTQLISISFTTQPSDTAATAPADVHL